MDLKAEKVLQNGLNNLKMNNQPTYGEMIYMVEVHILKKTGKQVTINLPRNVGEIKKLIHAYKLATNQIQLLFILYKKLTLMFLNKRI